MWAAVSSLVLSLRTGGTRLRPAFAAVLKAMCVGYFIGLSWLLLCEDPTRLGRFLPSFFERFADPLGDLAAVGHLLGFAVLAALVLGSRWPVSRWTLVLALVAWAVGTELLQALVPGRTPELADCLLDLAGIAMGAATASFTRAVLQNLPSNSPPDRVLSACKVVNASSSERN